MEQTDPRRTEVSWASLLNLCVVPSISSLGERTVRLLKTERKILSETIHSKLGIIFENSRVVTGTCSGSKNGLRLFGGE